MREERECCKYNVGSKRPSILALSCRVRGRVRVRSCTVRPVAARVGDNDIAGDIWKMSLYIILYHTTRILDLLRTGRPLLYMHYYTPDDRKRNNFTTKINNTKNINQIEAKRRKFWARVNARLNVHIFNTYCSIFYTYGNFNLNHRYQHTLFFKFMYIIWLASNQIYYRCINEKNIICLYERAKRFFK